MHHSSQHRAETEVQQPGLPFIGGDGLAEVLKHLRRLDLRLGSIEKNQEEVAKKQEEMAKQQEEMAKQQEEMAKHQRWAKPKKRTPAHRERGHDIYSRIKRALPPHTQPVARHPALSSRSMSPQDV
jgi:hypothetical protein